MKQRFVVLFAVALVAALALVLAPASVSQAGSQDTYFKFTGLATWSCTPGAQSYVTFEYGADAGDMSTHYWWLTNLRNGAQTTSTVGGFVGPFVSGDFYNMPVPAGTQAGDTLEFKVEATSALYDGSVSTLSFNCSTGAILSLTFHYLPLGYQAEPIPAGFVLSGITCDTAVYSSPGGGQVAGAKVTAGQTWFANPVPVTGADGASWTEIFLAGPNTAFIPTACVGAAP